MKFNAALMHQKLSQLASMIAKIPIFHLFKMDDSGPTVIGTMILSVLIIGCVYTIYSLTNVTGYYQEPNFYILICFFSFFPGLPFGLSITQHLEKHIGENLVSQMPVLLISLCFSFSMIIGLILLTLRTFI